MSYLDSAPTAVGGPRRIEVIDQTLRDGPQSWWGMKLRKDMGLPMAEELDRTGFHTIDLVGSSIFEVLARHCREDPWEQLISLSRAMPRTTVRAGTRSNRIVTFGLTADSVMDLSGPAALRPRHRQLQQQRQPAQLDVGSDAVLAVVEHRAQPERVLEVAPAAFDRQELLVGGGEIVRSQGQVGSAQQPLAVQVRASRLIAPWSTRSRPVGVRRRCDAARAWP